MISADNHHFQNGVVAYKNRQFEEAIDLLQAALETDPADWTAKFYLAMCLTQANRPKEAKAHFVSISDFCPEHELRQRALSAINALGMLQRTKPGS